LPLIPVLPWQRPGPTRDRQGRWIVCGNPKGRPTNRERAARLAAMSPADSYAKLKRIGDYDGLSPRLLNMIANAVLGKFWKMELSRQLWLHHQTVRRWAVGQRQIPPEIERHMLALLLNRARQTHFLVRTAYRRAQAAHRAKQELAKLRQYKRLSQPVPPRTEF